MIGTAIVILDGVEQTRGDLELGVFCGDDCRGTVLAKGEDVHWLYYLTVAGTTNDQLTFRLYDHTLQQELDVTCQNEPLTFVINGEFGDWDVPYEAVFTTNVSNVQNITAGDWSDPTIWGGAAPSPTSNVTIAANCTLDEDVTVASLTINTGSTLTIESGHTLVVTGELISTSVGDLVIADGGQLINASANVNATLQKDISAYTTKDSDGWYLIGSPMDEMPIEGSAFTTPEYDLYRYNETSIGEEWENYKAGNAGFTTFENGRGYLYANNNNFTPAFVGTLNHDDISYNVTFTDRTDGLSGINLVGNPFPHAIYKGAGGAIDDADLASGFYTLNNEGAWSIHIHEDAIMPGQGILVRTTTAKSIDIVKTNAAATAESGSAKGTEERLDIVVTGANGMDRTFVYFGQGIGLEKMDNFSSAVPSLWIHSRESDYAIAHVNKECESLDVFFNNRMSGEFRLSVNPKNCDLGYLRLIDEVAGTVVDLLQEPDYVFQANGNETDARFRLVFMVTTGAEEETIDAPFAYVVDGRIVLIGVGDDASLNVYDMTGRTVSAEGRLAQGVYVLRLMDGKTVKTQKIVVK